MPPPHKRTVLTVGERPVSISERAVNSHDETCRASQLALTGDGSNGDMGRSAAGALTALLLAAVPRCDAPGAHARQPHADRAGYVQPSRTGRQRARSEERRVGKEW